LRSYSQVRDKHQWERSVDIGNEENPAGPAAWSQDGKWIVTAGWHRRASIWDASAGTPKADVDDKRSSNRPLDSLCTDIASSSDGEQIAIGAASGNVHIYKTCSSHKDPFFLRREHRLGPVDEKTKPAPYSLAFDPRDRNRLFVAYMPSPLIAVWKIDEGKPELLGAPTSGTVWRVDVDSKGEFLASATNDAVIRLWRLDDSHRDPWIELRGHLTTAYSVAVNPENQLIASGSNDGTIRLWSKSGPLSPILAAGSAFNIATHIPSIRGLKISVEASDGSHYRVSLPADFGEVRAAAVSANGAGIAVVPSSGRPLLWVRLDADLTAAVRLPEVRSEWESVAFIDNDARIAAKTKEGKIFAWPFYSDVRSLELLAKQHLPVRCEEGGSSGPIVGAPNILIG
jgi:hypothetical protein